MFPPGRPILVVSHPRSGTHLTIDLIRKQFPDTNGWKYPFESFDRLYLSIEGFLDDRPGRRLSEKQALKILRRSRRPIVKAHAHSFDALKQRCPRWMEWLESESDLFYVYRDVRSVMPSLHLFMQSFHAPARTTFSDFIRQDFIHRGNRIRYWAEEVTEWLSKPSVTAMKYEDIVARPESSVERIASVTSMTPAFTTPTLPVKIEGRWRSRLVRFTSIRPETTAIVGYYRGQRTARWQTVFSEEDLTLVQKEAGDVMRRLGYT